MPAEGWTHMVHPDLPNNAPGLVTEEAYREVWAPIGWQRVVVWTDENGNQVIDFAYTSDEVEELLTKEKMDG